MVRRVLLEKRVVVVGRGRFWGVVVGLVGRGGREGELEGIGSVFVHGGRGLRRGQRRSEWREQGVLFRRRRQAAMHKYYSHICPLFKNIYWIQSTNHYYSYLSSSPLPSPPPFAPLPPLPVLLICFSCPSSLAACFCVSFVSISF